MRVILLLLHTVRIGALPCVAQQLAVTSRADNVVVFHDVQTGGQVARVAVSDSPHEIALDWTRHRAFVANYGGNSVQSVDLRTLVVTSFVLADYGSLHGIAVNRAGDVLWVTAEESDAVLEVDARSGAIVRVWPTQGEQSHMVVATPDGRKLYVANIQSGTVSVINRATGTTTLVETGAGAEGIDITPDGEEVWVSNREANTISVIETTTDRLTATVGSGGAFPVKVRARPDGGEVWVANNQSGSVVVFDRATRRLVATIDVGVRPLGLAFSTDGGRAFVTRPGDNEIVEIAAPTRTIERRFATGASPDGIVWIP